MEKYVNDTYKLNWKEIITKNLRYRKPFFLNSPPQKDPDDDSSEQVFVLPCFIKPGKQFYSVMLNDQHKEDNDWFIHKCLAPVRDEDIPICKI